MGQPAARATDMHVCPMVTGIIPHVGGPILPPGAPLTMVGGPFAARVSDMATCVGPPDVIAMGSPTVLIGNMMVMGPGGYRFGDYWKLGLPLMLWFLGVAVVLIPVFWSF